MENIIHINSENLTLQTFGKEKKTITAAEVIAIPK